MAALMVKATLTQSRDKRVEELELRLKSMEEMIKARVPNDPSTSTLTSNDVKFGDSSGRPDPHSSSNQSEFGTSNSSSYSDPSSIMASGKARAWEGSTSEGRTGPSMHSPNLMTTRIFESSP